MGDNNYIPFQKTHKKYQQIQCYFKIDINGFSDRLEMWKKYYFCINPYLSTH